MNVWLDDMRKNPDGWVWAKNYKEAVDLFTNNSVIHASLDHDLDDGWYSMDWRNHDQWNQWGRQPTGYDFVLWIMDHNMWTKTLAIHSDNRPGVERMQGIIEQYGPYESQEPIKYEHINWYVGRPKYE